VFVYVRLSEEFWTVFDAVSSFLRRLLSSVRRVSILLVVGALLSTTDAVRDVRCVSRRLLLVKKTCLPILTTNKINDKQQLTNFMELSSVSVVIVREKVTQDIFGFVLPPPS